MKVLFRASDNYLVHVFLELKLIMVICGDEGLTSIKGKIESIKEIVFLATLPSVLLLICNILPSLYYLIVVRASKVFPVAFFVSLWDAMPTQICIVLHCKITSQHVSN